MFTFLQCRLTFIFLSETKTSLLRFHTDLFVCFSFYYISILVTMLLLDVKLLNPEIKLRFINFNQFSVFVAVLFQSIFQ